MEPSSTVPSGTNQQEVVREPEEKLQVYRVETKYRTASNPSESYLVDGPVCHSCFSAVEIIRSKNK